MIYMRATPGLGQFLAACVPPYEDRAVLAAAGCRPERILAAPGGGSCAICCPDGTVATCPPGSRTVSRDANGCARCCVESEDAARAACPSPTSIVRDAAGCWNCLCSSGPASISCPPGYTSRVFGGRTCCVPPPPPTPPVEPPVITECPAGAGWRRGACAPGETTAATDPASGCVRCAPAAGCVPTASVAPGTSPCSVGKRAVVKGAYTCCENVVPPGVALVGVAALAYFLFRR